MLPARRLNVLVGVAVGLLFQSHPSLAQQSGPGPVEIYSSVEVGLRVITFTAPQGTLNLRLPDDIRPGDTLTGTVLPEPSGTNDEERNRNLGVLNGYVLEVLQERKSAREKMMTWVIPTAHRLRYLMLLLRDGDGRELSTAAVPVDSFAADAQAPVPPLGTFEIPALGQVGQPVAIRGPVLEGFRDGEVRIGGQVSEVVAASPRVVLVAPPVDVTGPTRLEIMQGSLRATADFRNVAVLLSATHTNLIRGQRATLTVTVEGLQQLQSPLTLTLENLSPAIVDLQGSPVQQFRIETSAVRPDGTFSFKRGLRRLQSGGFQIRARVVTPPQSAAGPVDLDRAVSSVTGFWQRHSAFKISEEAQRLVRAGVQEKAGEILRAADARGSSGRVLATNIVDSYLCALRDQKMRALGLARMNPAHDALAAFALAPQAAQPRPPSLEAEDVRRFTFSDFWNRLKSILNRSVSYLEVDSAPAGAEINIDGNWAGLTRNSFVVTPGRHRILVASKKENWRCEGIRNLEPERTANFVCRAGQLIAQ